MAGHVIEKSNGPNAKKMLSIVIPAYNEEPGIESAVLTIKEILEPIDIQWEIIIVDDGSQDQTFKVVSTVSGRENRIKGIRFSRNFGKESAVLAGLKLAQGDAVITLDADLQHPPKMIPPMVEKWREGAKVVNAVKRRRGSDSVFKRLRAKIFNSFVTKYGGIDLRDSSDFKLLDRLIVDTIVTVFPERKRFYRGLTNWVGFKNENLYFDVEERQLGESKWGIKQLFGLATTAIVSFSSAPLRIVTFLGMVTMVFAFFVAAETLISWFTGHAVSGFATIILTLLILGSFIMISMGIIGEYIAKIYDEIKQRPPYLIEDVIGIVQEEKDPIEIPEMKKTP